MSYPGTTDLEIVGVMRSCVNSAEKQVAGQFDNRGALTANAVVIVGDSCGVQ